MWNQTLTKHKAARRHESARQCTPERPNWLSALLILVLVIYSAGTLAQTTFAVNSLADDGDMDIGDGSCETGTLLPLESTCTLRAAIQEANAIAGLVTIEFDPLLPTDVFGRSVIQPATLLPPITNRITIDGATHADYVAGSGQPRVVLRYSATGSPGASGLLFTSGSNRSTVRALAIEGFPNSGIVLLGGGGFTIEQCTIGLAWHPQTLSTFGNGQFGIVVDGASATGASNITRIRNNVISYNGESGILITGGSEATFVQDNVIGLRPPTGTQSAFIPEPAAGNGDYGIHIAESSGPNNVIGGFGQNTISNNLTGEILIEADAQMLTNNLLGLPHDFLVPPNSDVSDFGRGLVALDIDSSDNTIGGIGNINHIGNASAFNIRVGRFGDTVSNNYIGHVRIGITPDGLATGTNTGINLFRSNNTTIDSATIANHSLAAISVNSGSGHEIIRSHLTGPGINGVILGAVATVGGDPGLANVIGGFDRGVFINDTGPGLVQILNNFIGTDYTGADLGNDRGIEVINPGNTIDIRNNRIAFNDIGVLLNSGSTETWVQGNIFGETNLGQPGANGVGIRIRSSDDDTLNHRIGYGLTQQIPGNNPVLANVIAYSAEAAIEVTAAPGTTVLQHVIRGNRMYANAQGIDLGPGGDVIDPGDGDEGPNRLQNFPEFDEDETLFDTATGEINYRFRVRTASHNASYPLRVDFYVDASRPSAQGWFHIGTVLYPEDDASEWVTGSFTPSQTVLPQQFIVATAIDSLGNTSQFSQQQVPLALGDEIFADQFIQ